MSRHIARLVLVLIGVAFVACSNPTSPVSRQIRPTSVAHDDIPDTVCRTGYNVGQGRCNPE